MNSIIPFSNLSITPRAEASSAGSRLLNKNWGTGFSLLTKDALELTFNGFLTVRKAREVCKDWKEMIDVLTGIGNGRLTYDQLFNKVVDLAKACHENNLIPTNTTIINNGRNSVSIGYNDFIKEAKLSYSDALNVYWHLKARERVLTDPLNFSRLIHHVGRGDIPYIPLSRPIFVNLFLEKINSLHLSQKEKAQCFTFYPCRKNVHEMGLLLVDIHSPYIIGVDELEKCGFDLKRSQNEVVLKDQRILKTPIFFSKDEIIQLKKNVLSCRIENKALLNEIVKQDFFYGSLDRKGAIRMLQGCPPGTYLMRPSSSEKYDGVFSYTSASGEIVHAAFAIVMDNGKPCFFFEVNGLLFDSLESLIKYMSFWKNPLNIGTEIKAETKEMWSYIYTLPCYFPMSKTSEELTALATDSSKKYVFFFYDAEQRRLTMGSWDKAKLETTPIDENRFAELKIEIFDRGGRKNIVFLENTNRKLPTTNASSEKMDYEYLKHQ